MMMLFRLIGKHSTRNKTQCKYVMSTLFKNLLFAKLGSCQVVYKISRNVIKGFLLFCHDVLQKIRCTDGTTKIKNLKRRKTKNTWNQGSRFRSLWLTVVRWTFKVEFLFGCIPFSNWRQIQREQPVCHTADLADIHTSLLLFTISSFS